MKKEHEPSGLSGVIAAIILIAILSPVLEIVGGIVSVLIIIALLAVITSIVYAVVVNFKSQRNEERVMNVSKNEDVLFYQKFISENKEAHVSEKSVDANEKNQQIVSFDFENTVESFDENYFLADSNANALNDFDKQEDFWNNFFAKISNLDSLSSEVKDRLISAKEYTEMVQGIKKTLGIYSSRKCGYSEATYYTFMQENYTESAYSPESGLEFEEYCASLLSKNNFEQVEVTSSSGDQGIDIIAYSQGVKYGIQCKFYSKPVGNKAVQEAFAGKNFYKCHVAIVLTNNKFTKSAIELADSLGVVLWDGNDLKKLEAKQGALYE